MAFAFGTIVAWILSKKIVSCSCLNTRLVNRCSSVSELSIWFDLSGPQGHSGVMHLLNVMCMLCVETQAFTMFFHLRVERLKREKENKNLHTGSIAVTGSQCSASPNIAVRWWFGYCCSPKWHPYIITWDSGLWLHIFLQSRKICRSIKYNLSLCIETEENNSFCTQCG